MGNISTQKRDLISKEEIFQYLNGAESEYGMYSEIFDRQNGERSVGRYIDRGESLPSVPWTKEFVQAGGSFDSCGSWGVTPSQAVDLEEKGIPASFAGQMLALLGRADYDFCHVTEVYAEGIVPKKRSEFHATVRGISRLELARKAGVPLKSTLRFGWMTEIEFRRYCLRNIKKIAYATRDSINGISATIYGEYYNNDWEENQSLFEDKVCLQNLVFANWAKKNASDDEMNRRRDEKKKNSPREEKKSFLSLKAAKIFARFGEFNYYSNSLEAKKVVFQGQRTSLGLIVNIHNKLIVNVGIEEGHRQYRGDGINFDWINDREKSRTTHSIRQVAGFSVCKIASTWFVWQEDFLNHLEGQGDLHSVIEMAEKRRKRNSLILSLNDVRNDRSGTAGFCLQGTKWFLQNRMPFVYRMVALYNSWAEIPEEIMSIEWHLASRDIFIGYSSPVC